MDPSSQLIATENALRDLIRQVLVIDDREGWLAKSGVTEDRIDYWRDRQTEESKRREGRRPVGHDLLDFSDLPDLITVIAKNWEQFKMALGNKKRFDIYMDRIAAFRVAVMHSRELLPFEKSLLDGMSGEIRNKVTIFLAGQDPNLEYFPRIEYVRDSFGNEATETGDFVETGLTVRVGEVITFEASAWDPENAGLTWKMNNRVVAGGPVAIWDWQLTDEDVNVEASAYCELIADRSYHKHQYNDGGVIFTYRVLPR